MTDDDLVVFCARVVSAGSWAVARVGRSQAVECRESSTGMIVYRWPDRRAGPRWGASTGCSCAVGDTPEAALEALERAVRRTLEDETVALRLLEGVRGTPREVLDVLGDERFLPLFRLLIGGPCRSEKIERLLDVGPARASVMLGALRRLGLVHVHATRQGSIVRLTLLGEQFATEGSA